MASLGATYVRPRKVYARIKSLADIPYLIELQKDSYNSFLQRDIVPGKRRDVGLQAVFDSVFPIKDFAETASVEYVSYSFDKPKYTVAECRQRGMSYAAPLKVIIRLVIWDADKDSKVRTIRDVKEQEVYFGEMPLMTDNGTFIINGIERVVVSQLHRSSGVFFDRIRGKGTPAGRETYTARVIPYRGSWLDFEFDNKDILYVRIDRRRKIHATVLLKAMGYSDAELLNRFYQREQIRIHEGIFERKLDFATMRGQRAVVDIVNPKTGKVFVKKNRRVTSEAIKQMKEAKVEHQPIDHAELVGKIVADEIRNKAGELVVNVNEEISEEYLQNIIASGVSGFSVLFIDGINVDASFRNTLLTDKVESKDEALLEIYKRLRPGDPPTTEAATVVFNNLFFNADRYDLSAVGRMKINERLGVGMPLEKRTLSEQDIFATIEYLLKLKVGNGTIDDIDNLGNRRVRAVGELLENQYRIGLLRIDRAVRERLQLHDVDALLPHDFINNKPASAVVREFFGGSQLSQFMDQTNPLSEVTHKRRLSALGPGGLSRERAGFEVRDVHPTHYGRICPVETPEGPNIGLISSLAAFARVNEYGFIETPYRKLGTKSKTPEIRYYTATEEHNNHVVAQSSITDDVAPDSLIGARRNGEGEIVRADEADIADVSTTQLVSVAASLIPFLQNDDANRALMGSNMQRQAVPLLKTRSPLVGTGMERVVAKDSGASIVAKRDGVVAAVDANRIIVKTAEPVDDETEVGTEVDIYDLEKYKRSNLDTCINQKPIVKRGEKVRRGDIIGDGFATEMGELALGQNIVVAFMPWNGYNFEDSILISERVVRDDLYTSIHIQEFECVSRDTKLGQEEITADIPNVGEEALADLDESGIIRIGAEVEPNDLLVGKITPKGETQLSPEEKLLRAIFGEKAGDVRDTSLRVPPGVRGTIIGAKIFAREGAERDERSVHLEETEIARLNKNEQDKIDIIKNSARNKIATVGKNEVLATPVASQDNKAIANQGDSIDLAMLDRIGYLNWEKITLKDADKNSKVQKIIQSLKEKINSIRFFTEEQRKKVKKGDELPPGVIKMVKVYVAIKRKLSVGDKMAGRHGNKGVVSRILPEEDMPYLADGRAVDVILNPLSVPSRMNVGQILETHLGWAARALGEKLNRMVDDFNRKELEKFALEVWDNETEITKFIKKSSDKALKQFISKYREGVHLANPVFDGANEQDIHHALKLADQSVDGQVDLYDGLTGDRFDKKVTVGVMYVLKLHHLVDEKIHARSIGPYSLVTQQPLGGKAQFGGQRLGEMEVWAIEAYGAAHTLQEFLTVKSDDVLGRTRMYESIVKGQNIMTPGLPESFNVLIKELQSLGLEVKLIRGKEQLELEALENQGGHN